MKKFLFIVIIFSLLFTTIPAQACGVPLLPSSFYGYIKSNSPLVGEKVSVYTDDILIAETTIYTWKYLQVYSLNIVSEQECSVYSIGASEGDILVFKILGRVVGQGIWESGTNKNLNLFVSTPVIKERLTYATR